MLNQAVPEVVQYVQPKMSFLEMRYFLNITTISQRVLRRSAQIDCLSLMKVSINKKAVCETLRLTNGFFYFYSPVLVEKQPSPLRT